MIDERHEELAALHALDLLEGTERDQFAAAVAADPTLAQLVAELREAAAALAHTAPGAEPPAALKTRVLTSVAARTPDNLIRPPASIFRLALPWAAAAGFALIAALLGQRYLSEQAQAALFREQVAATEIALKSARNETEAAQIFARRQLDTLNQQLADSTRQLADSTRQLAATQDRAASAESRLADSALQLADARKKSSDGAQQLAQLTARLAATTSDARTATAELQTALAAAQTRVATLQSDLQTQGDLANFKITTLASLLKNSPQAIAVAVWNPAKQEGLLKVEKLPALAADKDYQLWVVDPQYKNPVDAGVFTVDPQTGARNVKFTGKQPISSIAAYAVTLERKGGVEKSAGPFLLLGK